MNVSGDFRFATSQGFHNRAVGGWCWRARDSRRGLLRRALRERWIAGARTLRELARAGAAGCWRAGVAGCWRAGVAGAGAVYTAPLIVSRDRDWYHGTHI
jgi:hypothetical protein